MPRNATVLEVMIGGPSDIDPQRKLLTGVVADWNSSQSKAREIVLQPRYWRFDVTPSLDRPPQDVINQSIADQADLLIAVFYSRLGTPTESAVSGTAEEIERVRRRGKPVLVYFSATELPANANPDELKRLQEYKTDLRKRGLCSTFDSDEDLRRAATKDLARESGLPSFSESVLGSEEIKVTTRWSASANASLVGGVPKVFEKLSLGRAG